MRSNKIHNVDLFTQSANEHFQKHIKTKSKNALEILKVKVDWHALAAPLAEKITEHRQPKSPAGRDSFSLELIIKCFVLQSIYGLSDPRLEEEIADRRSFQIFLDLTRKSSSVWLRWYVFTARPSKNPSLSPFPTIRTRRSGAVSVYYGWPSRSTTDVLIICYLICICIPSNNATP